jgi:hypothetical protein
MSEHRWGPKFRCINGGCAIIQHASRQGWWRRGWGHSKWRTPFLRAPARNCRTLRQIIILNPQNERTRHGAWVGQQEVQ